MMFSSDELDELIDRATIDAYDESEQVIGFECMFTEDLTYPIAATVIGVDVDVEAVRQTDDRRGLIAVVRRGNEQHEIALEDVSFATDAVHADQLHAAYRRWWKAQG